MPTELEARRAQGLFVIPARGLLLASGLVALSLAVFNLPFELRSTNVDVVYVSVASVVAFIWLVSLVFAYRGSRLGIFVSGLIGFVEFAVIAAAHFETAPWDIDIYANHEGLLLAGVLIALLPACALTVMAAIVCWTHPRGRLKRLETLPLLIVALAGAVLVILQTTDGVRRRDFGTLLPEDGAFAAAVAVIIWLVGAFLIGRARLVGGGLILFGTFAITDWFIAGHLVGGTPVSVIASKSGLLWAAIAGAAAILAASSFLVALGFLGWSILRRVRPSRAGGAGA